MEVIYNGKIYTSINSLWRDTGVSKKKLRNGINSGIPVEDIVANYKKNSFEFEGICYKSLKDFIKRNEIIESMFMYIYYKCNRDIAKAVEQYNNKVVEYNGVKYRSHSELCTALGLSEQTFSKVFRKLGNIDGTVEYILKNKHNVRKRKITYNGKEYKNIKELCIELGIKYDTFINRRRRLNTDSIEAVVNAVTKGIREVTVEGCKFKTQIEMCKHYGVPYYTYLGRRNKGATIEEALKIRDNHHVEVKEK